MDGLKELLPGVILLFGTIACILNSKSARRLAGPRGFVFETQQIFLAVIGLTCLIGSCYLFYKFFVSF